MKLSKGWKWIPTLYFAEGLPYVAVMTVAVVMYKKLGLSLFYLVQSFEHRYLTI